MCMSCLPRSFTRPFDIHSPLPPSLPPSLPQIVLVAATTLLEYVPKAVLGSIICTCIMNLFDFHDMWR